MQYKRSVSLSTLRTVVWCGIQSLCNTCHYGKVLDPALETARNDTYRLPHIRRYFCLLAILCVAYLVVAYYLNNHIVFSVDEFWFAHLITQYQTHIPYRDFAPYKTVLGYYLLSPPFYFSHNSIGTLITVKNMLACFNVCCLAISAIWLTRFFDKTAILFSLLILLTSDVFLAYATDIRVDLLAYWSGCFALIWLLEKRYFLAGLLMGLGFAISQKILWYVFAGNIALCASWLIVLSTGLPRPIKNMELAITAPTKCFFSFNSAFLLIVAIYMAVWSYLSNWHTVYASVFNEGAILYHLNWYDHTRSLFWTYILLHNLSLLLLYPFALLALFMTYPDDTSRANRFFTTIFSLVIIICLIFYKQIFPYYTQAIIPVFLILYAAYFTWLFGLLKKASPLTTYIIYGTILLSILTTVAIFIKKINGLDGAYQKANVITLNRLLEKGDDYVAGITLIYHHPQPIIGLQHLVGPAVDYLYFPKVSLKPIMLASLEEDPTVTKTSILAALDRSTVKYFVNNYRIEALPPEIKAYLNDQFAHLWGSIYVYAPRIPQGAHITNIRFSGRYRIESNDQNNGNIMTLTRGSYTFVTKNAYRLKWIPNILTSSLKSEFSSDQWDRLVQ